MKVEKQLLQNGVNQIKADLPSWAKSQLPVPLKDKGWNNRLERAIKYNDTDYLNLILKRDLEGELEQWIDIDKQVKNTKEYAAYKRGDESALMPRYK